ncbi:hypothetical protein Lfu02_66540 [Longispora fulva]|uniref:Transcriptional regulator with XRE-family HTH domain n=1 Tax=Longispora fulva TaxID=619741 RepID=A0A8J7GID3_9ACTN|nr:helix-turn-helix transcriptional regulator [Longispora fulva]MBG6138611.1 transcriptional regulator with XRE-family HTH domain [Longispora fulva]GIG62282.1 hypothetical protein Lfu02_66540 [Longispora fulva]
MNLIQDWLNQPDGMATRLRALRTRAGLASKSLAEANGWPPSKVSKLENGKQAPAGADIDAWVRTCGGTPTEAQELLELLEQIQEKHQDWRRRMRQGQAEVQTSYNELVSKSRMIRHFETVYVPGLIQTAEYARRVFSEMVVLHDLDVEDIDAAVAARMQRQQMLYDGTHQFEFLLAEPVLRWMLCPAPTMRGQLDRLQTIVGMPNIRFGILPMGRQLATTPQNSFQLYDDLAVSETFVGETQHDADESAAYLRIMERLWSDAVVGEPARQLIIDASKALGATHGGVRGSDA